MTSLKTIAATAVIAVAGTVAAFSGLHLGQSPADAATAAQPAKAKASYTVTLTAKDLARLATMMNGQQNKATVRGTTHHKQQVHHQRQTTHHASYASAGRSYTRSGNTYSQRSGYRCYGYGHSGNGGSGHGCGGGCW